MRDFLKLLEEKNDLIHIKDEVNSKLEITEIHKYLLENSGPAAILENVIHKGKKSAFPVLINLFGAKRRIAWGLGVEVDQLAELGDILAFLRQPTPPSSLKNLLNLWPVAKAVLNMRSKKLRNAPCQEVVIAKDDVDLDILPIQTCWPDDAGPLLTWPLVITKCPKKGGEYNVGIYRMQQISKNKLLMRWLKHRGGADHHRKSSQPLPAAIVLGADPATILSAVMPLPENLSELKFSGVIRKKPIELVKCKTIDLEVPASAEIVIEGHVSLDEYLPEGPFGDHTGYYNEVDQFPSFTVSAITMRKNPIFLTTYTGRPPDEPSMLAEALNEVFVPIIKKQFPEIVDFWLPPEGCSYRIAIVSIKKSYPGHAKRIMLGVWSYLKQFIYTKIIIVVDEKINARSWPDVMWAISTKFDASRDLVKIDNTPIDYLDFASAESGLGGKMGIDATDKIYPETKREWGVEIKSDPLIKKKAIDILLASWPFG